MGSLLLHVGSFIEAHGFSSCGAWTLECTGLVVAASELSCSVTCEILVPQPGIEPASPALQDGLLTTGLQGIPDQSIPETRFIWEWGIILPFFRQILTWLLLINNSCFVIYSCVFPSTPLLKHPWRESLPNAILLFVFCALVYFKLKKIISLTFSSFCEYLLMGFVP